MSRKWSPAVDVAQDELFDNLRQWMHSHTANALIDNLIHALAEKQRNYAEEMWPGSDTPSMVRKVIAGRMADLIDPEVEG